MDIPLLNALIKSAQRQHSAFYAPGHKQGKRISPKLAELLGTSVFTADLPELPELDNLFAPEGVIAKAQELAADTFGAARTWFLVNGSTSGIVASILAVCGEGDKIILPRNIHQSAIAGLILSGAVPIFINLKYDTQEGLAYNVTPDAVQQALIRHSDAKAVMMLHPTYQGICSDLKAIADITHQYNIPLLVDEAHGAHFAFHDSLPSSAISVGADLTVQSTHKTLSAMTQASMLHIQGDKPNGMASLRICPQRISKALQLVQSTSPSYLLLASLDAARHQMATQGKELMDKTIGLATQARNNIGTIPNLSVLETNTKLGCHDSDITRLTINVSQLGITGFEADEILHEQLNVTCELPLLQHLTFIISLGNTTQDIQNLVQALTKLSCTKRERERIASNITLSPNKNLSILTPRQAYFSPTETIPIDRASDRLCGELICPYPPGIPLIMPGEVITVEAIKYLQQIVVAGGTITGCKDPTLNTIQVIDVN